MNLTLKPAHDAQMGWVDFTSGIKPANTVQQVASGVNSRLNWDQIFGLGSQALAAFGKNPTTQIGGLTVRAIQPAQPSSGYNPQTTGALPQPQQLPNGNLLLPNGQIMTAGQTVGTGVGSGIDGIFSFVQNNLLLVGGAGLGLFLLFREPPRRR